MQNNPNYENIRHLLDLDGTERLILKGMISGDGDIGGRMASSSPEAISPISDAKRIFLEKLANDAASDIYFVDVLDTLLSHDD